MQSVKIRNMETEESVWLNIPSSYQAVREVFAGLGEPEMVQIVSAEVQELVLEKRWMRFYRPLMKYTEFHKIW